MKRYSDFLKDDYTERIIQTAELSDVLIFQSDTWFANSYNTSKTIRETPTRVQNLMKNAGKNAAVWLDKQNDRVGIAFGENCEIFLASEITRFEFCTIVHGGLFENQLNAIYSDDSKYLIIVGFEDCNSDFYQIEPWLNRYFKTEYVTQMSPEESAKHRSIAIEQHRNP